MTIIQKWITLALLAIRCSNALSHERLQRRDLDSGILEDELEEDDHDDFELYDIIVQSENIEDWDIDIYTDEDRQGIVDLHNLYRANFTYPIPEGSNMKMMEYNRTLEWAAGEYLKLCKFEHGRADNDNISYTAGQNLYNGMSRSPTRYMYMYYIEYLDWNFENQSCREDPSGETICGHFTQLMWGMTQHVGCARRSHCFPRSRKILASCHYLPGGNIDPKYYVAMYRYGTPCTRSQMADGNLCHKNLTVDRRMCQNYNLDCECVLDCKNCATPNFRECRCDCKEGWDYPDCGQPCEDIYHWIHRKVPKVCEQLLRRPDKNCEDTFFIWLKCRKACGRCTPFNSSSTPDRHCCGGKRCDWTYVLDTRTCQCEKDCPTFGCLYKKAKNRPLKSSGSLFQPGILAILVGALFSYSL